VDDLGYRTVPCLFDVRLTHSARQRGWGKGRRLRSMPHVRICDPSARWILGQSPVQGVTTRFVQNGTLSQTGSVRPVTAAARSQDQKSFLSRLAPNRRSAERVPIVRISLNPDYKHSLPCPMRRCPYSRRRRVRSRRPPPAKNQQRTARSPNRRFAKLETRPPLACGLDSQAAR